MPSRRFHVVLNAHAGTANALGLTPEAVQELFDREGHRVTIDADMAAPFAERIERARAGDADVVVAAGGDGTATALAAAIVDTDKTLAILPLGTMNLLAKDLGVPLSLPQWVAALGDMEPRRIDLGEVNGRIFLHKVVVGFVPGLAAAREQIRGHESVVAKLGFLRHLFRRLLRARRFAIEIRYRDGTTRIERALSVAVASNGYEAGLGRIFARDTLDGGNLTLYVLKHLTPTDFARLSAEMVVGTWKDDEALQIEDVGTVTIRMRKPLVKVMLDGEVETLETPLRFRIRPGALTVLAPAAAGSDVATVQTEAVAGA
jgi:diacylglycerol kinase family enzyme